MYALYIIFLCIFFYILELAYPKIIFLLGFIPKYHYPWSFITSIFLHANLSHLLYNLMALLFLGLYFESKYGSKNFLSLFFISGIIGNIFYWLLNPYSTIPGIGASGGISGLIGALAVLEPFSIVFVNMLPIPLILFAFFWFLLNFLGIFYPYGNIGYEAHLGGLITGILYGLYLKKEVH